MGTTARLGHFNIQISGPHSLTLQFYGVTCKIGSRECLETLFWVYLRYSCRSTAFGLGLLKALPFAYSIMLLTLQQ